MCTVVGLVGIFPLAIVFLGSLMEPGDYAGVRWGKWTPKAWIDLIVALLIYVRNVTMREQSLG